MPSFDVVSEVDQHELTNAVDQTNREIEKRFDFKGSNSRVELKVREIVAIAESEFQVEQILEILRTRVAKRGIDTACLEMGERSTVGKEVRQPIVARHGIDKEMAKKVQKLLKESKIKVQAAVQDEQVRVTGKKRDDLQEAIALLRQAELDLPIQFTNFRD
jgi:hypothetical protein